MQRVDLTKDKNKFKLATSKFKQGMRLLTMRRVKFLNSFRIEAKSVAELETELLNGLQSA